ncbi:MAG TPA: AtpZ/AtpI family protein [Vicinamibacterales bacterium]|nr:AtpZ/AtpI family protein [Vicinamibacterales bacterium]
MGDERGPSWFRTLRSFNTGLQQAGPAATTGYSLIGALGFCGGLGYLADRWLGTAPTGLVVGMLFGVVAGLYLVAKAVWHR